MINAEAIIALSEPTIPLSVIEDIKAEIEINTANLDGYIELSDFGKGVKCGLDKALEIIDRKVNEVTKNVSEL